MFHYNSYVGLHRPQFLDFLLLKCLVAVGNLSHSPSGSRSQRTKETGASSSAGSENTSVGKAASSSKVQKNLFGKGNDDDDDDDEEDNVDSSEESGQGYMFLRVMKSLPTAATPHSVASVFKSHVIEV